MKKITDSVRLATDEEAAEMQKHYPGIKPMSRDHFDRAKSQYEELCKIEEESPLLKPTAESLDLFGSKMELRRAQSEWIERLERTPIKAAIQDWLRTLNQETARNYAYYVTDMMKRGIIPELDANGNEFDVGLFNHFPHERVIDHIKTVEDWSEGTRQVRAACYISFTAHLSRSSQGWFRKAEPSKNPANPTFYQVRDKCATDALSLHEVHCFIGALAEVNYRDALIARTMLQGAKRLSEVLQLVISQVDFEKCIIQFRQLKTGGMLKTIPISYPDSFMEELRQYIEDTSQHRGEGDTLFVTRNGKPLTRSRMNYSFDEAKKRLVSKDSRTWSGRKVSPHSLRATWVTLAKQQGVPDTDIMKVTGHTSAKMVYAYDKTSAEDNLSKTLILI